MLSRRGLIGAAAASLVASNARAVPFGKGRAAAGANLINLISHGDSITQAGQGGAISYGEIVPSYLFASADVNIQHSTIGYGGMGYNYIYPPGAEQRNLIQDLPISVFPAMSGSLPNWLVTFAGTNDLVLGGYSPSITNGYLQTYIDTAVAGGFPAGQIIIATMLPRQSYSETLRGQYIADQVATAASKSCLICRLDQNGNIGAAGQQSNTYYYQDQIHPTQVGQNIVANMLYATLVSALGITT